ncbi:MAG: Transcriptional regulator, GntR family [Caulobacter sp.]|nr:Transcriptional regulator, GntR family [Caulobacter sp.]
MHIAINTTDARPIYVQIMDEVRRALVLGALRTEDPLPSVRQLAGDLRLNPNTVAQAYRELEREGVVYVRRGQGTFVADRPASARDRDLIVREVAARALLDAHRHGLSADDLIAAVRQASDASADTPRAAE